MKPLEVERLFNLLKPDGEPAQREKPLHLRVPQVTPLFTILELDRNGAETFGQEWKGGCYQTALP
jgi:hypothetical protein